MSTQKGPKEPEEKVKEKMAALKIQGWSAMGEFTPDDHLEHLKEIEALKKNRKKKRGRGRRKKR